MKKEDQVLFYKLEFNDATVPEVTACVRINQDLRVKLFFKGLSLPLPQWFIQGRDTRLSSKSMLQNFVSYIKIKSKSPCIVADELQQVKLMKRPSYSSNTERYALMRHFSALPTHFSACLQIAPRRVQVAFCFIFEVTDLRQNRQLCISESTAG